MRTLENAVTLSCAIASLVISTGVALASHAPSPSTNQIRISYVPPKNPAHRPLHDVLKAAGVLEEMQSFLSPLRLPRPLLLRIEGCDGVPNAWYDDGVVTVCYEYLDDVWRNAHDERRPAAITLRSAIVGPLVDVFLHEVAHAMFDILNVPVFGREEDAADGVSAYVVLQLHKDEARELVLGAAYAYANELKVAGLEDVRTLQVTHDAERFADEHGTPAQRLFSLLCIAYGADQKTFAEIVNDNVLPRARAEGCEFEYQQVAFAYHALIAPHVDGKLARKVRGSPWLPVATLRPHYHYDAVAAPVHRP